MQKKEAIKKSHNFPLQYNSLILLHYIHMHIYCKHIFSLRKTCMKLQEPEVRRYPSLQPC